MGRVNRVWLWVLFAVTVAGAESGCMTVPDRHNALLVCADASFGLMARIRNDLQRLDSIENRLARIEGGSGTVELRVQVRELVVHGHGVLMATATHATRSAVGAALPRPSVEMVREAQGNFLELRASAERLEAVMRRVAEVLSSSGEIPVETTSTEPALHLRLSCDRLTAGVKDHLPIHVFLENPSPRPIRAVHPKYNRFGSFRVIVTDAEGEQVSISRSDRQPYFYYRDPTVRRGATLVSIEVPDEDGVCTLPPHLVWEGILGSFMIVCGDTEESSSVTPVYLSLREPGHYTIRVDYVFDRAHAQALLEEWGEPRDLSDVPEMTVRSNEIPIRIWP